MAQGLAEGKVALVTGAGGGIGRATAELFAREGARGVLVVDLKDDGGEETVERIRKDGGDARYLRADVTDESQVELVVRTAVDTWGRLDCAHNNAGTSGTGGPFTEFSLEEFNRVIAINLTAVFLCMKHELRQMVAQAPQGGAIVNTSSGAGGDDEAIGAAMRATVPQGELGRPEWLAESVVWLCSDRAGWVNGESMLVDGGTVCR
jgi:NAD(P)-dependent dehydrogenase (short-subunit alcohol dehydrogenase family)